LTLMLHLLLCQEFLPNLLLANLVRLHPLLLVNLLGRPAWIIWWLHRDQAPSAPELDFLERAGIVLRAGQARPQAKAAENPRPLRLFS
jgi:hypothetical protein